MQPEIQFGQAVIGTVSIIFMDNNHKSFVRHRGLPFHFDLLTFFFFLLLVPLRAGHLSPVDERSIVS